MSVKRAILPDWSGHPCVIIAGGPSLSFRQILAVQEAAVRSIAVNNAYLVAPFADVLYGGDFLWHKVHNQSYKKLAQHAIWTQDSTAAQNYGLSYVKGVNREGLGKKDAIHNGGNSGYQAINLAYLFGCRRILLLGFDMKLGSQGEKHWHPDHEAPLIQAQTFPEWLHKFKALAKDLKAAGCEVINCTPGSALTEFPMSSIEAELPT